MRQPYKVRSLVGHRSADGIFSTDDRCYHYTMLVAWHKFDRYERQALAELLRTTKDKIPFLKVGFVCKALLIAQPFRGLGYRSYASEIPYKEWRMRIYRAATKKERQRRQRIKL